MDRTLFLRKVAEEALRVTRCVGIYWGAIVVADTGVEHGRKSP